MALYPEKFTPCRRCVASCLVDQFLQFFMCTFSWKEMLRCMNNASVNDGSIWWASFRLHCRRIPLFLPSRLFVLIRGNSTLWTIKGVPSKEGIVKLEVNQKSKTWLTGIFVVHCKKYIRQDLHQSTHPFLLPESLPLQLLFILFISDPIFALNKLKNYSKKYIVLEFHLLHKTINSILTIQIFFLQLNETSKKLKQQSWDWFEQVLMSTRRLRVGRESKARWDAEENWSLWFVRVRGKNVVVVVLGSKSSQTKEANMLLLN